MQVQHAHLCSSTRLRGFFQLFYCDRKGNDGTDRHMDSYTFFREIVFYIFGEKGVWGKSFDFTDKYVSLTIHFHLPT